jgi:surface antigen
MCVKNTFTQSLRESDFHARLYATSAGLRRTKGLLGLMGLMPTVQLIAAALAALALASCSASEFSLMPQPASVTTTGSIGNVKPGVANAGVLGNGIGGNLDERDRKRAYDAEVRALEMGEPGEPVGWHGAAGRYGTVVPGVPYEARGTRCRDYSHTIYIGSKPQAARASACRNPDGTWSPVS